MDLIGQTFSRLTVLTITEITALKIAVGLPQKSKLIIEGKGERRNESDPCLFYTHSD